MLVIPATIVLEVANVLISLGHPKEAMVVYKYFPTLNIVAIDDDFVKRAIPLLEKVRLKTADAIIAVSAALGGAMVVSWDKKLLKETGKLTEVATPEVFLKKIPSRKIKYRGTILGIDFNQSAIADSFRKFLYV